MRFLACVAAVSTASAAFSDVHFSAGSLWGHSEAEAIHIVTQVEADISIDNDYPGLTSEGGGAGTSSGGDEPGTQNHVGSSIATIVATATNTSTTMTISIDMEGESDFDDENWIGFNRSTVGTSGIEIEVTGSGWMTFSELFTECGISSTRRRITAVSGTGASISGSQLTAGCYTIEDMQFDVESPSQHACQVAGSLSYVLTIQKP